MAKLRSQNGLGQKYLLLGQESPPPPQHTNPFSISRDPPTPTPSAYNAFTPRHYSYTQHSGAGKQVRFPPLPTLPPHPFPQTLKGASMSYHRSHFNRQEDSLEVPPAASAHGAQPSHPILSRHSGRADSRPQRSPPAGTDRRSRPAGPESRGRERGSRALPPLPRQAGWDPGRRCRAQGRTPHFLPTQKPRAA